MNAAEGKPVCKDTAWARNLAASMTQGHGRHNSGRDFRQEVRSFVNPAVVRVPAVAEHRAPSSFSLRRVGELTIKNTFEACAVGDCVPVEEVPDYSRGGPFVDIPIYGPPMTVFDPDANLAATATSSFDRWTFERVLYSWGNHGGRPRHQVFWKRIS